MTVRFIGCKGSDRIVVANAKLRYDFTIRRNMQKTLDPAYLNEKEASRILEVMNGIEIKLE